jgi:hypothetical protein
MNKKIRALLRSKFFLILFSFLLSLSLSLFIKSLNEMDENFHQTNLGDGFGEINISVYPDHFDS